MRSFETWNYEEVEDAFGLTTSDLFTTAFPSF